MCEDLEFLDNLEPLGEKDTLTDSTKPGEFDNRERYWETLDSPENPKLFGDKDVLGDFPTLREFDILGDCEFLEALDNSVVAVVVF